MRTLLTILCTALVIGCGSDIEVREDGQGNLVRVDKGSGQVTIIATAVPPTPAPTATPDPDSLAKETRSRMRTLGTALEQFGIDNRRYPTGSSVADIWNDLHPTYIGSDLAIYENDAWGRPLIVNCNGANATLISLGSDGRNGGVNDAADVIYKNGEFTQW